MITIDFILLSFWVISFGTFVEKVFAPDAKRPTPLSLKLMVLTSANASWKVFAIKF